MSDHSSHLPEEGRKSSENQSHRRPRHQHQEPQPSVTAPPRANAEEWVTIGRIVAVFGVHGDLKVLPQTDLPDRFTHLREVFLGPDHRRYRITKARPYREGMAVIHLAGIEVANEAERLIGQALMIPLSELPALPPDQYYIHDLIGLRAQTPAGQVLGTIVDVLATGSNDVYVVREAGTGRDVLVPAVKEMIKRVDIPAGLLIIDPIPGIFDDRFEIAG